MKKILFGIFGVLLGVAGANATDIIKTATTNTVNKKIYNINYGSAATTDLTRGYRKGVIPQTKELETVEGGVTVSGTGNSLTVGGSAVTVGQLGAKTSAGAPLESITANTANIMVLERDKLVTPGTGNCEAGKPCGYVTIGNHGNDSTNHVWVKIVE